MNILFVNYISGSARRLPDKLNHSCGQVGVYTVRFMGVDAMSLEYCRSLDSRTTSLGVSSLAIDPSSGMLYSSGMATDSNFRENFDSGPVSAKLDGKFAGRIVRRSL